MNGDEMQPKSSSSSKVVVVDLQQKAGSSSGMKNVEIQGNSQASVVIGLSNTYRRLFHSRECRKVFTVRRMRSTEDHDNVSADGMPV